MLTQDEDVDVHACNEGGRSRRSPGISGGTANDGGLPARRRQVGVRAPAAADPFGPFVGLPARLAEDPHLWATTLYDEVTDAGAMTARIPRSPGSCGHAACGRIASRATGSRTGRWR